MFRAVRKRWRKRRWRALNGKSKHDRKRGALGVDDEYGPEADIFCQYAAKQRTQGEP